MQHPHLTTHAPHCRESAPDHYSEEALTLFSLHRGMRRRLELVTQNRKIGRGQPLLLLAWFPSREIRLDGNGRPCHEKISRNHPEVLVVRSLEVKVACRVSPPTPQLRRE